MKNTDRRVAVVIGAGDATGGAIAKRFAKEGYAVVVTRRQKEALEGLAQSIRNDGGDVHAFGCDARNETDMESMFKDIEADIGSIEVVIFNIGANVRFSILETTERVYRKVWEMGSLAGFLTGRAAARVMLPRQRAPLFSLGPRPRCAVLAVFLRLRVPSSLCELWRKAWPENWGLRGFMLHTLW